MGGLKSRPSDYETDVLPTVPTRLKSTLISLKQVVTTAVVKSRDFFSRLSIVPGRHLEPLSRVQM